MLNYKKAGCRLVGKQWVALVYYYECEKYTDPGNLQIF